MQDRRGNLMSTQVQIRNPFISIGLYCVILSLILISGCHPSGNQVYSSGEFSFSYSADDYIVKDETTDGPYTSFFLEQKKQPSNRIEFSIYRYEPDFVKSILPTEMAKEIQMDVLEVGKRATANVVISEQSGLILPDHISFPYTVDAVVIGKTADSEEDVVIRISSTQINHYNVITVSRGDSPETVRSYSDILSSFQVTTN